MARLPVLRRRRRSKAEQALDLVQQAAKTYTSLKIAKTARAAAKGYAGAKTAKVGARGTGKVLKFIAVPAAVAGGAVVWRKRRNKDAEASPDFDRPLGPVATAETVSPPAPVSDSALS
jgi:hypothetical protein